MNFNFVFFNLTTWLHRKGLATSKEVCSLNDIEFASGKEVWILKTFKHLQFSELNVSLSEKLDKNAINIIHRDDFSDAMALENFVVCIRADKEPAFSAQVELLQNGLHANGKKRFSLPHWPQGGIITRDPSRNGIKCLSFFGKRCHIAPELASDQFLSFCKKNNLTFDIHEQDWSDYSSTDIVLAVRDGFSFYLDCKPASKLVNAWIAGVPAIINPEYGYTEIITGENDAILVSSLDDILTAITTLIESPEQYFKISNNGKKRADGFTCEKVAAEWRRVLKYIEKNNYLNWQKKNRLIKRFEAQFSILRAKIWGQQVTQYPDTLLRHFKSYLRISFSAPILCIRQLFFSYQYRLRRKTN